MMRSLAQARIGVQPLLALSKILSIFVLLFSKAAAASDDIIKELSAATLEKKLIVPVRLEDLQPKGAFLYELASRNWINAFENTDAKLDELAKSLAALVKSGRTDPYMLPFDRNAGDVTKSRQPSRIGLMAAGAGLALALAIGLGAFLLQPAPAPLTQRIAFFGFEAIGDDPRLRDIALSVTNELAQALNAAGLDIVARGETTGQSDLFAKAESQKALYVLSGDVHMKDGDVVASVRLDDARSRTNLRQATTDGLGPLLPSLPTRLVARESLLIPCIVNLRGSLKRDDMDVVMSLGKACDDIYTPGPSAGSAASWLRIGLKTTDSARMQAATANMLSDLRTSESTESRANLFIEAEKAANRAFELDPNLPVAHMALYNVAKWKKAGLADQEKHLLDGMKIDANDPFLVHWYANFLKSAGRINASLAQSRSAARDNPLVVVIQAQHALGLVANGDSRAAADVYAHLMEFIPNPTTWATWMGQAVFEDAGGPERPLALASDLLEAGQLAPDEVTCWRKLADLIARGDAEARAEASKIAVECLGAADRVRMFVSSFYPALGEPGDAFDRLQIGEIEPIAGYGFLYVPSLRNVRADKRFTALAEQLGLLKYWKIDEQHRPDFCAYEGEKDFDVCKAIREQL